MNKKDTLVYLIKFGIIYFVCFIIVAGIESGIIFLTKYGWQYNTNTIPTLVSLSIAIEILPSSLIIALIMTPIIIIIYIIFSR